MRISVLKFNHLAQCLPFYIIFLKSINDFLRYRPITVHNQTDR